MLCDRISKKIDFEWLKRDPGVLNEEAETVIINMMNYIQRQVGTQIKDIIFINHPYFLHQ